MQLSLTKDPKLMIYQRGGGVNKIVFAIDVTAIIWKFEVQKLVTETKKRYSSNFPLFERKQMGRSLSIICLHNFFYDRS